MILKLMSQKGKVTFGHTGVDLYRKGIFIILMLFVLTSCTNESMDKNKNELTDSSLNEEDHLRLPIQTEENEDNNLEDTLKEKEYPIMVLIGEREFDLNSQIMTWQIQDMKLEHITLLRNAIFAKHGYHFKDEVYLEFFSTFEWYEPEFEEVTHLFSHLDNENLERIISYEEKIKAPKSMGVIEIERNGIKYRFDFMKTNRYHDEIIYDKIVISISTIDGETYIYDTDSIEDKYFVIWGRDTHFEDVVLIKDLDQDGVDEIILKVTGDIQSYDVLLKKFNQNYSHAFIGYAYETLRSIDVNKDGVQEIINDHTGGGGYVSIWTGLKLVNELVNHHYVFSYDLTWDYYTQLKEEMEKAFAREPSETMFVNLLNIYADMGLSDKCMQVIRKNPDLADLEAHDYSGYYYSSPDMFPDFFSYVMARANYYRYEWNNMMTNY